MEWKVFLATQNEMDYDLSSSSWIGDYNDPNTFLEVFLSNNGNNRTGWRSPHYDQLLREGNLQTDPSRREKLLEEGENVLVLEQAPLGPLLVYKGITLFDYRK